MFTVDPRNLVFVDESGVNLSMTRLYGRAFQGQRVVGHTPRNSGQNVTLLGALSLDGLIATMCSDLQTGRPQTANKAILKPH